MANQLPSLHEIPLDKIIPDPKQPRQTMDAAALHELTRSIQKHGVLQPILLRKTGKKEQDPYVIVAGERRYRATKKADLSTVPAIFTKGNPAEVSLVENLLRENLSPLEEAEAMERFKMDFNYTNRDIAEFLGKSAS
ncbi:ParB/RepB/Spo0J family partition protein, partial [Magnetococcales bacterium HHB-1]